MPDGSLPSIDIRTEREKRRLAARGLRDVCPRSAHAANILGQGPRDPLVLVERSNAGRLEHLMPVRFSRMLESPLAFFRGTAILQAYDLKGTPSAGIIVQACGDCHLMNFGMFASPERTLLFDINDFDETFPAPFEWDVKRLAASFAVAARWRGFDRSDVRIAAATAVDAYRIALGRFAEMKTLEIWYARVAVTDLLRQYSADPEMVKRLNKRVDEANKRTSEAVFQKITKLVDGEPRIIDEPPLLYHVDPSQIDLERDVVPFFAAYKPTLQPDRRVLLDRFRLVDVAMKVVGVGSVGTRCYVTLWMGDRDDPLFLQIKEARASVLEGLAGSSPHAHNGERVVYGQRLMQSASDIFLGWARGQTGTDYYVRQLRDHKAAADLPSMSARIMIAYAEMCGQLLARAHAKSGEAPAIRGYIGSSARFDEAIADYAVAYADQSERDYETFRSAVRAGRFPVESLPKGIEGAIR